MKKILFLFLLSSCNFASPEKNIKEAYRLCEPNGGLHSYTASVYYDCFEALCNNFVKIEHCFFWVEK
mgnify:CR=1 FL=1